jgi:hypothetical protein
MYRLRVNGAAFVGPAQIVVNNEEINTTNTVATMISDLIELECKLRDQQIYWLVENY